MAMIGGLGQDGTVAGPVQWLWLLAFGYHAPSSHLRIIANNTFQKLINGDPGSVSIEKA